MTPEPGPEHYTPAAERPPHRGEVKIHYEKTTLFVALGDGPPQITDGYGGWEEVTRPHDEPITRWIGQPALRMELPLLLDNYRRPGGGVQRDLDRILALGRKADGHKPPPVFRVTGAVPFSGDKWVMAEMPEMGDALYEDGKLARQFLVLSLLSFERSDTVKFKRLSGDRDDDDRYTVKEGDTLRKIAAKLKPDASNENQRDYANKIGDLNGIRDIRRELNPGRELKLP